MRKTVLALLFFASPVVLVVTLFAITSIAGQKPPLPPALLAAKSAYLLNKAGADGAFTVMYDELKKWGRWEILDAPEKADLLISFGYEDSSQLYSTPGQPGQTIPILQVSIVIAQTGSQLPLWSSVKHSGIWRRSTARTLVKDLRKRIEEK